MSCHRDRKWVLVLDVHGMAMIQLDCTCPRRISLSPSLSSPRIFFLVAYTGERTNFKNIILLLLPFFFPPHSRRSACDGVLVPNTRPPVTTYVVVQREERRLAERRRRASEQRILRCGLIKEERKRRVEKVTYRSSVVSCCLRRDKPPLSARMCPGNRERGGW